MRILGLLKVGVKSILKNRMRSLLTMLGIIIGVAAVIVMVAIGRGVQMDIEKQISALGTNLIIIFPGASMQGGISQGAGSLNRLTLDDADILIQEAKFLGGVSPLVMVGDQVIGGGKNWNTSIQGVSVEYLDIRDWSLSHGTFFTERDVTIKNKVAVLGHTVAEELFPGQNPVGERIQIRNIPFTIIGILEEKGQNAMGMDQDDIVLAPSTTVAYRLSGEQRIRMILASAVSPDFMDEAQMEITTLLRREHRLNPDQGNDFTLRNQTEITETASETSRILTILLGSIACVSLIVGGIGIMNIMLVTVTERTREIGIRLAIGARGRDVLIQFLIEAVVLSLTGGFLGVLSGLAASLFMNQFTNITTWVDPAVVFMAFSFSGAVGIFFGFYPARKAAALDPIEALRYA
ncbi:MAG: ABC transporter permease [Candidatus Eisenbacteria bacterium]|uniref:ABC transporter permease n=1 Tax=Eiseniibacteriota bacterium TaxID=2212470 RepID=A0A948WBD7_UNCEI|nr:ABC transporter permease [Candidatus Eisenbacteria bacterium]MBU1948286.1 ABC transporter permease [Candidatus Eisenbacteria bacterium]MBU2689858.1 ABC transporter permease [Candidatus Eisenbacteria bacterium]